MTSGNTRLIIVISVDEVTLDLLGRMLAPEAGKRITAAEALAHPYFRAFPPPSNPKELVQVDGDSHEFLLRVQQGNKVLSVRSGTSSLSGNAKTGTRCRAVIGARKRALFAPEENSVLAPSTKESCTALIK